MKNKNLLINAVLGAIALTLLYTIINFFLDRSENGIAIIWSIFSNFLVALLLGFYVIQSKYIGVRLTLSVFLIYFMIGHFNILIEAYIFNVTDREQTLFEITRGFFVTLVFSPFYIYLMRDKKLLKVQKVSPRSVLSWVWRILTANFLYLIFYITAGLILSVVYPELMEFYKDKIPPIDVMIKTQLYLRGFIFIGIAILILRSLSISLLNKAILIGLIFAVIGGIAPLIQPNELMPAFVRFGHGIEVGISNFLFGFVISYLLAQRPLSVQD